MVRTVAEASEARPRARSAVITISSSWTGWREESAGRGSCAASGSGASKASTHTEVDRIWYVPERKAVAAVSAAVENQLRIVISTYSNEFIGFQAHLSTPV